MPAKVLWPLLPTRLLHPANQCEPQLSLEVYVIIPDVVWDSFDADVSLVSEHVTVQSTLKSQWAD